MARPILILQLRPEDEASDGEFADILSKGGLTPMQAVRVRLDAGPLPPIDLDAHAAVIVGGGPGCVSDDPATRDPLEARMERDLLALMPAILDRDMPFLGCCAGIGILAHHLGAEVSKRRWSEPVGPVECRLTVEGRADPLFGGLPGTFTALVGHKEAVQALPPGCVHLAASDPCRFQAIRWGRNVYATQFHPEADGETFASRIRIYRSRGYFPPDEADRLTALSRAARVTAPPELLRRFCARYAG